jgi:carboxymethylenebutenolidase
MAGEAVEFEQDGVRVSGYLAHPEGTPRAGMIVIQEWWGLNDDIKDIAQRYAKEGYLALAPDMYHGRVTEEPDDARKLAMALERDKAALEIDAAVHWLKKEQHVAKVGCVGFCMGGGLTLATALRPSSGIDAAHVYYGGGMPEGADLSKLRVPVMGSYGSDEAARAESLETALTAGNIEHDVKVYEGAGHGFFNASHIFHPAAAADSWERAKGWFARHLAN